MNSLHALQYMHGVYVSVLIHDFQGMFEKHMLYSNLYIAVQNNVNIKFASESRIVLFVSIHFFFIGILFAKIKYSSNTY